MKRKIIYYSNRLVKFNKFSLTWRRWLVMSLLIFVFPDISKSQFYSGSHMDFGKNRVQHHDFFWSHYRFEKYNVYFYKGGDKLAVYTAKYAHKIIDEMETKLDFVLETQVQFIVYNKLSDLMESNVGLLNDEQYNTGGVTHIVGSKVIVYFDGNHTNFESQIRAGIAQIILNQMMYGEQIGSMVKNSALVSMPEWYLKGLSAYFADNWNTNIDNRTKDGFLSGRYNKFNNLTGQDAADAGHSLWYFVSQKYGKTAVPNIVYMSLISRDIEDGFLYVIGVSYKNILEEWKQFYATRYEKDLEKQDSLPEEHLLKKIKKSRIYDKIKISPNGNLVAYTTNEYGKYKVWLYDLETHKSKFIMKAGYKLDQKIDESYPLLEWHPTGRLLSILVEKKGSIVLYYYQLYTEKVELFDKIELFHFDKISDFSYSYNGRYLAFSATMKGKSDIYVYDLVSHDFKAITNDPYDDLEPAFINKYNDIVFASNRPDANLDTNFGRNDIPLLNSNYDLFLYSESKDGNLVRYTNTPDANEREPLPYDSKYVSFLSDESGVYNRYLGYLDSSISFVDTVVHYRYYTNSYAVSNFNRNIETQDVSLASRKTAEIFYDEGKYKMFIQRYVPSQNLHKKELESTVYKQDGKKVQSKNSLDFKTFDDKEPPKKKYRFKNVYEEEEKIDINNYDFNKDASPKQGGMVIKDRSDTIDEFRLSKKRNYNLEFNINKLISQVDFSFLNTTYQPYTGGNQPVFINPGFNGLFKVGVADLFEDYRVTGGVKLSSNFKNNEYILSFENLKYRLDKQLVFYRRGFDSWDGYSLVNHKSHEARYIVKWPFDQVISARGSVFYRNDKAVTMGIDDKDLAEPNAFKNWLGTKGELVYDDTRARGVNIYFGTRAKIFGEYYKQIDAEKSDLIVLGADFRNYQQIHKNFIWANRLAASTSLGSQRLIYYMGSVDNWWNFSKNLETFNRDTPIDRDINWAYQTLATNMRGFSQNIRNGNSFALINSELRLPVFSYFINRPIKSDMIRNFQVVAFGDVGTAWTGKSPYDQDNSLYKKVYTDGSIRVTVNNLRDPIVYGYGFGLRTRLLGYFIRTDWAWGVEEGIVLPNVFYISLSTDF